MGAVAVNGRWTWGHSYRSLG